MIERIALGALAWGAVGIVVGLNRSWRYPRPDDGLRWAAAWAALWPMLWALEEPKS